MTMQYAAFAQALTAGGVCTDPWVDGTPRFRSAPFTVGAREAGLLAGAAEAVAGAYHEAALLVLDEPRWLDEFFLLSPVQKLLWQASAPFWHGIARADVFFLADGRPVVCELNADTPSGQPEAVLLGPLAGVPAERDPNRDLEAHFGALLDRFLPAPATVAMIYPTEIAGDFALIRLYQRWCERRGHRVVLGSPYNLRRARPGRVALFGTPCDIVLRHYKTDWWAERLPVWRDEEPYPDPAPLLEQLEVLIGSGCPVLNPFAAVLAQNKRTMAFLWQRRTSLSAGARAAVEDHLPETFRLEDLPVQRLLDEREEWVLKSDYGCEGEEVLIGQALSASQWRECLDQALPARWIAQRRFTARTTAAGEVVNHGVYLVAGQAAGLYARLSRGATDVGAVSAPVEVWQ
jgi:hypothetical protein